MSRERRERGEQAAERAGAALARATELAARLAELRQGRPADDASSARAAEAASKAVERAVAALAQAAQAHHRAADAHRQLADLLEQTGHSEKAAEHRRLADADDAEGAADGKSAELSSSEHRIAMSRGPSGYRARSDPAGTVGGAVRVTGGHTTGSADDPRTPAWTHHRLPHAPASAGSARRHLGAALQHAGVDDRTRGDAELVLTELITNAIRHGAPDAEGNLHVAWRLRGDRLLLSVQDSGRATDLQPGDLNATELTGRGLALVEALSDRWFWNADHGTHVVAELLIPPAPAGGG